MEPGALQMFAGIYRDFAGKSECGDFKFMGIECIPAIPVIFEVNKNYGSMYTANVCSDLQGLCGEIGVRGFQIYRDCMYTRNPCNF